MYFTAGRTIALKQCALYPHRKIKAFYGTFDKGPSGLP